ncbi:L,D-transpeptidase family protein [Vibrio sp. SCSIO 43137]|uniref:L,D-transpeptidase family protein n=1 Tax=Vibrio sp. SCSIO 43137 TaxID=3021011 RepID=UPI0023082755|nr:L,D-transpeptidase family protein [Vibrio sp. SCSIO 43137]WCE28358.1 L,D-transpeptidase family protein [Vibrio sp. SCSIO 43137]
MYRFLLTVLLICASSAGMATEKFVQLGWLKPNASLIDEFIYPEQLQTLYANNHYQMIWYQDGAGELLEAHISLLHYSELSDFFSRRYFVLQQLRNKQRLFEYDLLATDTLIAYQQYVAETKNHGEQWFYGNYIPDNELFQGRADLSLLEQHIYFDSIKTYITALSPLQESVQNVMPAIAKLKLAVEQGFPLYKQRGLKREGDKLPQIPDLLRRLEVINIEVSHIDPNEPYFDKSLTKAVKMFQARHGIKADGIIGPETLFWINYPLRDRIRTIALNTERARLYPSNKENIILVNLPEFELSYWHKGEETFSSKVIVGRVERKTPMLKVKLDTLIYNPTWRVPGKILREDIIPAIKRDQTYLEKNNFRIVESWSAEEEVMPDSINWDEVTPDNFKYKLIQEPGQRNALGQYKFNTPNPRAIFLHDTPSKHLFGQSIRAYSSGCVRVQYADKLAMALLNNQQIIPPQDQELAGEMNYRVPLKQRVPVYIIYQTSWLDDGQIQYRKDVYDYDRRKQDLILTIN